MFFAVGIFVKVLRDHGRRSVRPVTRERPVHPDCQNPIPRPASCYTPASGSLEPAISRGPEGSLTPPSISGPPTTSDQDIRPIPPSSAGPSSLNPTPSDTSSAPGPSNLGTGQIVNCPAFEGFDSTWCTKIPTYFRLECRLGKGTFADVFKAVDNHGRDVALKALDRIAHLSDAFLSTLLQREICNHKALVHENVVRFLGTFETDKFVFMVQELCDGGDLLQFSFQLDRTEQEIKMVVRGILMGLQECHSKMIVHADVKPHNVLLASDGSGGWTAKLADLGQSLVLDPARQWRGAGGLVGDQGQDSEVGTAEYAAPESFDCRVCDFKVDMWALGVVVYQLFFEVVPFEHMGRPYASEVTFSMPALPMSSGAKSFIQALLTEDPHARLSSSQALEHGWFCC